MCGRFALMTPTEALVKLFDVPETAVATLPPAVPRYNIAPTQPIAAIRLNQNGERDFTFFHWGLIPSWSKDIKIGSRMINARSETVTTPIFAAALSLMMRCKLPLQ